ncbi:MAG: alpha/beta hydrolase [Planctomycetota bacterium]
MHLSPRFHFVGLQAAIFFVVAGLQVPLYAANTDSESHVIYKEVDDGDDLELKIYQPADFNPESESRPAIVFFFGGGWVGGKIGQFEDHSRRLTELGMVAVEVQYRTLGSHGVPPTTCVADAKSAMRYVRSNAKSLGIDPNQIAAGGGSAGGHLAASTSLVDKFDDPGDDLSVSCRPQALVLFNPVIDNGPDGWGFKKTKEFWQEISPAHRVDDEAVPTVIFLGTNDKLIPVSTALKHQSNMRDLGHRCVVHLYKDAGHGYFNKGTPKTVTIEQMISFLQDEGFVPQETYNDATR